MAKVKNPLFPEGIGCLKYRLQKNPESSFTHTVLINKHKKRKKNGDN